MSAKLNNKSILFFEQKYSQHLHVYIMYAVVLKKDAHIIKIY